MNMTREDYAFEEEIRRIARAALSEAEYDLSELVAEFCENPPESVMAYWVSHDEMEYELRCYRALSDIFVSVYKGEA